MENKNYWELFWQTGLPAAWLLSRAEEKQQAVAAFAPEEVSPDGDFLFARAKRKQKHAQGENRLGSGPKGRGHPLA